MSKSDYLNTVKSNNTKRIEELNQMISNIDETIANCTIQKTNCQAEITKLTADNTIVDDIIKDVPVDIPQ